MVLDPAKVAGKIVVCQRGVTARVNKSLAVQQAGGVGMILFNSPDSSLNADFHFVPTVHVSLASGTAIKAYAATAGATASIAQATIVYNLPAPITASFSSRGPLRAGNGDLLKPDLIAPGQDILAGVAPSGKQRPSVRPVQRYVDVQPARGRPRRAAQGAAPGLVADGDQVGADDDRHRRVLDRLRTQLRR